MTNNFYTVFDLSEQPELIHPPYWFISIFVLVGVLLAVLAWFALRRRWRWRRSLPIMAALWIAICAFAIVTEVRDTVAVRNTVIAGDLQVVEGCLDYFRPGSPSGTRTTAGNEQWSVGGIEFSYGAGEVRPAFHSVSTAGGPMRADAKVRVSFVVGPAYRRREIIKLEVAPHACPPARQVEPFAQP